MADAVIGWLFFVRCICIWCGPAIAAFHSFGSIASRSPGRESLKKAGLVSHSTRPVDRPEESESSQRELYILASVLKAQSTTTIERLLPLKVALAYTNIVVELCIKIR